jgi:hypothetical protein
MQDTVLFLNLIINKITAIKSSKLFTWAFNTLKRRWFLEPRQLSVPSYSITF